MSDKKQFVGFGFGPIQSALFLYEAYQSGNFDRFTVAEVDDDLVHAVRENNGRYTVNIAHPDGIEQVTLEGVELYNPKVPADREKLVTAIARADEMATALPSVKFYNAGGKSSVCGLIADGLAARTDDRKRILYAAENNNHAAEILAETLEPMLGDDQRSCLQPLNTVVGKMSGVIGDLQTIEALQLTTLTPNTPRAVLVESFNRILITRINMGGVRCGIDVFVEKDDLLPFEEAKLYGHNAIHALIGYLCSRKGLTVMSEAADDDEIMSTARAAFIQDSGRALCAKYRDLSDPLFTDAGYRAYAEDLLQRIVNPYLNDLVARVIRDPMRKLGYDDRLFGTMRLALGHAIEPVNMAEGAAAAILTLVDQAPLLDHVPAATPKKARELTRDRVDAMLRAIWGDGADVHADALIELTWQCIEMAL